MLWYNVVFLILVLLHLLCCVLIFLGIQFQILKVRRLMVLVALFLPLWGELLVLILHFQILCKQTDSDKAAETMQQSPDSDGGGDCTLFYG